MSVYAAGCAVFPPPLSSKNPSGGSLYKKGAHVLLRKRRNSYFFGFFRDKINLRYINRLFWKNGLWRVSPLRNRRLCPRLYPYPCLRPPLHLRGEPQV